MEKQFLIAHIQKAHLSETASGHKLIANLPKPLAEYLKERGAIVIVITAKDFSEYLESSIKAKELKEMPLEEILHKLIHEKLEKLFLEALGLK